VYGKFFLLNVRPSKKLGGHFVFKSDDSSLNPSIFYTFEPLSKKSNYSE
jgi:hypothetical protein